MEKEVPDMIDHISKDGKKYRVPNPFRGEFTIGHFEHGKSDGERAIDSIDGTLKREISKSIQDGKRMRREKEAQDIENICRTLSIVYNETKRCFVRYILPATLITAVGYIVLYYVYR